jgi:hypothetical protein
MGVLGRMKRAILKEMNNAAEGSGTGGCEAEADEEKEGVERQNHGRAE